MFKSAASVLAGRPVLKSETRHPFVQAVEEIQEQEAMTAAQAIRLAVVYFPTAHEDWKYSRGFVETAGQPRREATRVELERARIATSLWRKADAAVESMGVPDHLLKHIQLPARVYVDGSACVTAGIDAAAALKKDADSAASAKQRMLKRLAKFPAADNLFAELDRIAQHAAGELQGILKADTSRASCMSEHRELGRYTCPMLSRRVEDLGFAVDGKTIPRMIYNTNEPKPGKFNLTGSELLGLLKEERKDPRREACRRLVVGILRGLSEAEMLPAIAFAKKHLRPAWKPPEHPASDPTHRTAARGPERPGRSPRHR